MEICEELEYFFLGAYTQKKEGVENLKDIRPISLGGKIYKPLAKVLTNRLKKLVGKVVSCSECLFGGKGNSICFFDI